MGGGDATGLPDAGVATTARGGASDSNKGSATLPKAALPSTAESISASEGRVVSTKSVLDTVASSISVAGDRPSSNGDDGFQEAPSPSTVCRHPSVGGAE
jgi:hypothetical protein